MHVIRKANECTIEARSHSKDYKMQQKKTFLVSFLPFHVFSLSVAIEEEDKLPQYFFALGRKTSCFAFNKLQKKSFHG
jgi:hypothetical protein